MEWPQFAILVLIAVAFFALIAWLRTADDGRLTPPGEPGDADRVPRDDVWW